MGMVSSTFSSSSSFSLLLLLLLLLLHLLLYAVNLDLLSNFGFHCFINRYLSGLHSQEARHRRQEEDMAQEEEVSFFPSFFDSLCLFSSIAWNAFLFCFKSVPMRLIDPPPFHLPIGENLSNSSAKKSKNKSMPVRFLDPSPFLLPIGESLSNSSAKLSIKRKKV